MSMLKGTFIIRGLLFCLVLEIQGSPRIPFTTQWAAEYTSLPHVVMVNGRLLVVALENNLIVVNSTVYSKHQSNTCELFSKENDELPNIEEIKVADVTALGNGKIVIQHELLEYDKVHNERKRWRQLYILDPFNCTTMKIINLRRFKDHTYEAFVPYWDSFDMFYHNHNELQNNGNALRAPYRYNDQGEQLKLDDHIGLENQYCVKLIQTIKPYDASNGYISHMYSSGGLKIRHLNSRFEVVKEVVPESNNIETLSVAYGKIGYCYRKGAVNVEVDLQICKFLDADFKTYATVEVQKRIEILQSALTNLPDGGGLLRQVEPDIGSPEIKIYVKRIDLFDENKREPVEIFSREMSYKRVMQTFLLYNREVCFANGGLQPSSRIDDSRYNLWIDCVLISNL